MTPIGQSVPGHLKLMTDLLNAAMLASAIPKHLYRYNIQTEHEGKRMKEQNQPFIEEFAAVQRLVHDNAKAHGWHEKPIEEGTALALIHSEVSEALDAARHGNPPSDHIPEFSGIEEELADVVIRCMDWAQARGYRLAEAIAAKHEFNKGRPHRHGGKHF